jgi:3'-phosphoadenosine 5'-phosphosulfate sulfotransferase (PAPS reductase)/FAD synthetase
MLLKEKQAQPLEWKIKESLSLIDCWYESFSGDVYVSFSGGKDSTVLLHLVRSIHPDVPAVFLDTGLEYPEIRQFVQTIENVVYLRPKMPFHKVIDKYGYPIISKLTALKVRRLRNAHEGNKNICRLYRTGYNSKGQYSRRWKLPKKWFKLIDAPFDISEQCCDVMKKRPLKKYAKESGRVPMIGMMAGDSVSRVSIFVTKGCNQYDRKEPQSNPMAFWTEKDVWEYIKLFNVPYSSIYDMGYDRTGCMFCMFGVHMEKEPNRFQLMKETHPKIWNYCIYKLGLKEVLEYIDIPYEEE